MDRDEVEVYKNAKIDQDQYPAILTEQDWSIEDFLYGFTFKLKLQQQNKTGHKTALLGKKFFIAGLCKIYFQCIFVLACNRGKQGILKESSMIENEKFRFSQKRKDLNRIRQTRHFQPIARWRK